MTGHLALLYRDTYDLIEQVVAVVGDGPVVVACRAGHREPLAARLAGHPVVPVDRPDIHTRPAAALAAYHRFTRYAGGSLGVTVIARRLAADGGR